MLPGGVRLFSRKPPLSQQGLHIQLLTEPTLLLTVIHGLQPGPHTTTAGQAPLYYRIQGIQMQTPVQVRTGQLL